MISKRYWGFRDLNALYSAFKAVTGREWDDAVRAASAAGSVRDVGVTGGQWDSIASIVSGRDRYQCAKRLHTEARCARVPPSVGVEVRHDTATLHDELCKVYEILCPNATVPMEPGYASAAAEDAHCRISALMRDRNALMAEVEWLKRDVSQRIANVSKDRDGLMAEVEHLRSRLDEVTGKMPPKGVK